MDVVFNSKEILHLSVTPGIKSWSIFAGVISVGVGASFYTPDEHILLKIAYLTGCLILGLTFLEDWEDCIFDKIKGKITMTRRNWFEWLTCRCGDQNTLVLDTSSVMDVRVAQGSGRLKDGFQVALVLRAGGTVPVSETCVGAKSNQENLATNIRSFLSLDRVETVRNSWADWTESEEEDYFGFQPPIEVESLKGRGNLNFEEVKLENENILPQYQRNDSDISSDSSSSDELFDDFEL